MSFMVFPEKSNFYLISVCHSKSLSFGLFREKEN